MIDPYATGVLVPEHHERLVADIDNFARDAGIQKNWIWTSMSKHCGLEEIEYFREFRQHMSQGEVAGLCYVSESEAPDPTSRMSVLAGALVRNFVRARVMTVGTVLDEISGGEPPNPTCLLIPNFHMSVEEGWSLAKWQLTNLIGLLQARALTGRQTVLSVSSMARLGKDYGSAFTRLIEEKYLTVNI